MKLSLKVLGMYDACAKQLLILAILYTCAGGRTCWSNVMYDMADLGTPPP